MVKISIIYGVVTLCDSLLTIYGISSGVSSEGNPCMQMLISRLGLIGGVFFGKALFCGIAFIGIALLGKKRVAISEKILAIGIILELFAIGSWLALIVR